MVELPEDIRISFLGASAVVVVVAVVVLVVVAVVVIVGGGGGGLNAGLLVVMAGSLTG